MAVPRDGEKVRRRLQQAALELYAEQGYDVTTAAEIAARAGVTGRTFFRHFADKREVLFDGEAVYTEVLVGAIRAAPADLGPWDTLFRAFRASEYLFVENRAFSNPRRALIARIPALQERALAKTQSVVAALVAALRARGVAERTAMLAAELAMAAAGHAAAGWFDDDSRDLDAYLVDAFRQARDLIAAGVVIRPA